jgi:integrase
MGLIRRGNTWYCRWEHDGKEIKRTTGTSDRTEAQEFHDRLRAELWRAEKLDEQPKVKWETACLSWLTEHAKHKRSYKSDVERLRWINPRLAGLLVDSINTSLLTRLRADKLADGVKNSTVNRHLAVISAILNFAHAHDWISAVPKIPYLPEPKGRLRYLTKAEAAALLAELPPHLKAMVRMGLATGLRRHNITHMEWADVDLDRRVAWVWPDEAKAGKAITIPLNDEAIAVLSAQPKETDYVFTFKGKPVFHVTTAAWKKACARSGLNGVTFHTLRHTWASWHIMAGTPPDVVMRLGGWADAKMVQRYTHLAPGYLAGYAGNVPAPVPVSVPSDSRLVDTIAEI